MHPYRIRNVFNTTTLCQHRQGGARDRGSILFFLLVNQLIVALSTLGLFLSLSAQIAWATSMNPIVVPARSGHSATVIMLHGLGDSGDGWSSIAHQLNTPWIKYIFPSAAPRAVTINGGAMCPAWADIKGLSPDAPEDVEGSLQTREFVHSLIAKEVSGGIPASRVVVGGFSQGAAMVRTSYKYGNFINLFATRQACLAGVTYESALGGCFILSGYLTLRDKLPTLLTEGTIPSYPGLIVHAVPRAEARRKLSTGGRKTPIFQAHGLQVLRRACHAPLRAVAEAPLHDRGHMEPTFAFVRIATRLETSFVINKLSIAEGGGSRRRHSRRRRSRAPLTLPCGAGWHGPVPVWAAFVAGELDIGERDGGKGRAREREIEKKVEGEDLKKEKEREMEGGVWK